MNNSRQTKGVCVSNPPLGKLEELLSLQKEPDFLSSLRLSQALNLVLTHEVGVPCESLKTCSSFIVNVFESFQSSELYSSPHSTRFLNFMKCLELFQRLVKKSPHLCRDILNHDVPQRSLSFLDFMVLRQESWKEEILCRLADIIIVLLTEMNRQIPAMRPHIRDAQGVRILLSLCYSSSELVHLSAFLLLCDIINEKENDYINVSGSHLRFLMSAILKNPSRQLEGMRTLKQVASFDRNKEFLIENKITHFFNQLLEHSQWCTEMEVTVYEVIWSLAFATESRGAITECPLLLETLRKASKEGRTDEIRRCANGVLWKLESGGTCINEEKKEEETLKDDEEGLEADRTCETEEEEESSSEDDEECLEVDGSYDREMTDDEIVDSVIVAHGDSIAEKIDSGFVLLAFTERVQDIFMKLANLLRKAGYETIEISSLRNASIQTMAHNVKQASAVLFEVSTSSKSCAWFREVLEISFKLEKPLVPLLTEPKFNPDGWLGLLCGSHLIYDMYEEQHSDDNIGKIFMELKKRGKKCCFGRLHSQVEQPTPPSHCGSCAFEFRHVSMTENTKGAPGTSTPPSEDILRAVQNSSLNNLLRPASSVANVQSWTSPMVVSWLNDVGIPTDAQKLLLEGGLNGELLFYWHLMLTEAPLVFYQTAHQELGLKLVDILRLTRGLHKLCLSSNST